METWTAVDESKWLELDKRRERVINGRRARLMNALQGFPVPFPGVTILSFAKYLEDNAVSVVAALEPYVLHPEPSDEPR